MANAVDHLQNSNEPSVYYSASYSPYLQGTEIKETWQLTNYFGTKIRSNTSLVFARSGSSADYLSNSDYISAFNDTNSPANFGTLITQRVSRYTPGRDPASGPTGYSTYTTFLLSGTEGTAISGSIKSRANLDVKERLNYLVSHVAEQRDLGQTAEWSSSNFFEECDTIEIDPTIVLKKHPASIIVPTSLVQAGATQTSFDGVIELQDIRRIADRSSIDMPFVIKGPKGSLSVTDDNMKSYQFSDTFDLRQISTGLSVSPYLDSVLVFGAGTNLIDQPGAFSDARENLSVFKDAAKIVSAYPSDSIDSGIMALLSSGTVSGSVQMMAADTNYFPTYLVSARHGFVFSQNDSYGYDSIAFGGLKK